MVAFAMATTAHGFTRCIFDTWVLGFCEGHLEPCSGAFVVLVKSTDGILSELFYLACVLEVCTIPAAEAFDRLLQNCWYWLIVDMKPLIQGFG